MKTVYFDLETGGVNDEPTIQVADPSLVKPKDLKLSTLCEYFSIATAGAHDALADVRMTVQLYRKLTAPVAIGSCA